ncbi:MAG TPA: hypothetical protein GX509_11125 [Firmicutes bacterium]|nr:hypothetical protein [Bacillota bacterium]HHY99276.1 hypothetical protein [Bacillota bacterium]
MIRLPPDHEAPYNGSRMINVTDKALEALKNEFSKKTNGKNYVVRLYIAGMG